MVVRRDGCIWVLIASIASIAAHPHCGFDDLPSVRIVINDSQPSSVRRRNSNANNQNFADTRFKVPSRNTPLVRTSDCTRFDANENLGFGYSECFIPEVVEAYSRVQSWPKVDLRTRIIALEDDNGNKYVTDAQINTAMTAISAEFESVANITFAQERSIVQADSVYKKYDTLNNGAGIGISDLASYVNDLSRVVTIQATGRQRTYHSYILIAKLDIRTLFGICFPEIMMLEIRPAAQQSQLSSVLGNICFVDYRYFLGAAQPGAAADSQGKIAIHELGHSLGLLHPHAGVDFEANIFSSPTCLSGGARDAKCRVAADKLNDFATGDMLSDTAPIPNMYFVSNGTSGSAAASYNTATCQPGASFPADCSNRRFGSASATTSRNHMGYSPDSCRSRFSSQQVARMRCFVDRYVQDARRTSPSTRLPLTIAQPTYTNINGDVITVEWYPPLSLLRGPNGRSASLPDATGLTFVIRRSPLFTGSATRLVAGSVYSYRDEDVSGQLNRYSYTVHARMKGVDGVRMPMTQAAQYKSGASRAKIWSVGLAFVVISLSLFN
eukprot:TRINITY_DN9913_c0_g1_i2.p1 TRINITY_DN9913_c0_g1~~TRINITY_DN9913_c0_g1_i2.p1  ORF type:complete len:554 (+),score=73.91 TRINITY_DN9913_c0_g1_i2:2-1663(+)